MKIKKNILKYKNPETGEYTPIPVVATDGVTKDSIEDALGYVPADEGDVSELNENLVQLEEVRDAFETVDSSNNILNPSNSESGYYELDSLAKIDSKNHARTIIPIPLVKNTGKIYYTTNVSNIDGISNYNLVIFALDGNGNEIKYYSKRFSQIPLGTVLSNNIPTGCTQIHMYMSGVSYGYTFENICISEVEITGYETYTGDGSVLGRLKEEYVPEKVLEDIQELQVDMSSVLNLFDEEKGNNILPLDSINAYISTDGITLVEGSNYRCSIEKINVDSDTLHIIINPECQITGSGIVAIVQYDKDGAYLSTSSKKITSVSEKYTFNLQNATTSVRIWTNDRLELYDICVSTESLNVFEPYAPNGKLIIKGDSITDSSLIKSKKLYGKTIVNFGDSIFGKRRPPEDISTRLAELTGATVHNCGFGGCRMAQHSLPNYDPFSMYRLTDSIINNDWELQDAGIANTAQSEAVPSYFSEGLAILKQLDFNKVDIITIAYGTNDFTAGVNMDNSDNVLDTTTFAGALRYSIENLLTAYPHLKIFVCSQTYRFWIDSNNVFTDDSDTHVNADSVKLTDFVAKTKEIAEDYHLPYINNYDIGMNKYNRGYYFPANDGTHPITTGCHLIAEHMTNELY